MQCDAGCPEPASRGKACSCKGSTCAGPAQAHSLSLDRIRLLTDPTPPRSAAFSPVSSSSQSVSLLYHQSPAVEFPKFRIVPYRLITLPFPTCHLPRHLCHTCTSPSPSSFPRSPSSSAHRLLSGNATWPLISRLRDDPPYSLTEAHLGPCVTLATIHSSCR